MNPSRSPILLPPAIGIAILAVSTASILIRFAQQDAPSVTIAALRLTFAALALAPIALVKHRRELAGLNRRRLVAAIGSGGFLAVHFAAWITSLQYTTVASSVVFVSTGPLWVALLSPLFLRERLGRVALMGLGLALIGGLVVAFGDSCTFQGGLRCAAMSSVGQRSSLWGNFLALLGAWAVTGYLIIGRRLRSSLSLIPYVFVVYGCAACFLLVGGLMSRSLKLDLSGQTYFWILLLALVPQLIGHSTYNWALKFLPAASVAVTTLGEPVGSAILAFFILSETPGPLVLVGGLLILAGIYLAARGGSEMKGAIN